MKQKLLDALKTKFKTLGFGDKAFDGVAEYLSKTVTEESQIETAISGVEPLLKSFQGDIDKVRNEKTELQKKYDELNKNNPNTKPADPAPPTPDEPAWFKSYREKQESETAALKSKLESFEKKETQSVLSKKVLDKLYEGKNEQQKFVLDMMIDANGINIESEDQVDAIVASYSEKFTQKYQQAVEKNVVIDIPAQSSGGGGDFAAKMKAINEVKP